MDTTEKIPGAEIQHGKFNNRIYLMKLSNDADITYVIKRLDRIAVENDYGKIFAKVKATAEPAFISAGYRREGIVPGLYGGIEAGIFLGKYPHPTRMTDHRADKITAVLEVAESKRSLNPATRKSPFAIRQAVAADVNPLAELYLQVFKTYPFPIFDPDYLLQTMDSHVVYFVAENEQKRIVAASSIEMDSTEKNAEMTDFATSPEYRGHNIATHLLKAMEEAAPTLGIVTAYTIARSLSYGMNTTFTRLNYQFGGTLINNTQIFGHIESMNVWHKCLVNLHI